QQILLILEGYGLHEFVLGTVSISPQSVADTEGNLVPNPDFLFRKQQDKLLAYWLLSTICDEILVHLTNARSSFDIWSTVIHRFASKSTLTVSTLRHSLYSQKKGQLTMKEYLEKIKSLCDTLTAVGNDVSEQEQISIILAGLPVEFESIRIANLVQQHGNTDDTISKSDRGARTSYRGIGRFSRGRSRGRKFSHTKLQCQLCG
ncbi:hypothetical protein Gotri_013171, partial [Gossypium trilobum]|nr:hypothetical protein [Gossypium trilobum]